MKTELFLYTLQSCLFQSTQQLDSQDLLYPRLLLYKKLSHALIICSNGLLYILLVGIEKK